MSDTLIAIIFEGGKESIGSRIELEIFASDWEQKSKLSLSRGRVCCLWESSAWREAVCHFILFLTSLCMQKCN
jgi:hypothetical protein